MGPIDKPWRDRAARVPAIARYALVCVAIGAAAAALAVAVLGGGDGAGPRPLPPVRQTQLVKAVQASGCELRRSRAADQSRARVDGARAAAARPQFYAEAPPARQLTGALRRGVIVILYRPGLDRERLEQLRAVQAGVPNGTIVTPDSRGMRYEVAAGAYGRLLRCTRFTEATIDAIRLFRGRYIGIGPDR
jgi:uncharacterized protein DUF3105